MWSRAKVALFVMLVVLASQAANAKTLRWSGKGDVTSMDPYAFYTTVNSEFLSHIYEPLVRLDRNLKFEPALATSWERIEPTVWRFHLRRDVKFHNGNPFSADDVVASLKRASDPNSPYLTATSQSGRQEGRRPYCRRDPQGQVSARPE
jgi:peptide/nickel transport system substrate-binding protein